MSVITISGSTYNDSSGNTYYEYTSSPAPSGAFASGSFRITRSDGKVDYTLEQAYEFAKQKSYAYLGLNLEDEIDSYNKLIEEENKDRV